MPINSQILYTPAGFLDHGAKPKDDSVNTNVYGKTFWRGNVDRGQPDIAMQKAQEETTTQKYSFPLDADTFSDVGQSKHTIQFIANRTSYFNTDSLQNIAQSVWNEMTQRYENSTMLENRDFNLEKLNRIYLKKPEAIFTFYMPGPIIFGNSNSFREISLMESLINPAVQGLMGGLFGDANSEATEGTIANKIEQSNIGWAAAGAANYFGYSVNPLIEILYEATPLRKFEFEFRLSPSSEKEAIALENMIRKFRSVSSPERQFVGGIAFKAPDTFDIRFMHNGVENTKVPKIFECVLENFEVDYTGPSDDKWSTFRTGHPIITRMRMQFKEKEIIDRYNIERGF